MKRELWNKCSECGKIISYADFEAGKAKSCYVSPSSEFSDERIEYLCVRCNTTEKAEHDGLYTN